MPDGPSPEGEWPLYAGVPFPAGLLWEASGWRVENEDGRAFPTQLEAGGHWAFEGSIQWLRVDTVADPRENLFLVHRPGLPAPEPEQPVRVRRDGDRILVSNGQAEYVLSAEHSPILSARQDGRLLADSSGTRGLYLVDNAGRTATASAEGADLLIEAGGPVAGCVRIEGDYRTEDGEALARHITRVEISAGMPFARVTHTLVLTRDTNETWFREIGWEFELAEGGAPAAFFGISREDPGEFRRVDDPRDTYLVQESYYRFGAGEKRFRLARGEEEILAGEEMGDWFLARNDSASLLLACRESARQHPKEFAVDGRLVNLMLFSPRAGEELDFRGEALVERWNLRNWLTNDGWDGLSPERRESVEEDVGRIRGTASNAAGWAKTHEILFAPGTGARGTGEASALSARHSRPVYALADPAWIYRSGAMGPLHPRDPERFPEAERLVDGALDWFASRVPVFGEWGFVDYYAGPHLRHRPGRKYPEPFRWALTYTLRPDSWRVFARSGRREAYDFATRTNRSWGDNYLASWGDDSRTKGLFTSGHGSWPFYWGTSTVTNRASSTNLNQFIWDYHLTGYRRAGDQVRDFARGLLDQVTFPSLDRDWRIIMTFRTMIQCYNFTWDHRLREMAAAAADSFEDPEGATGLTKERPYRSSTYKTRVDIRALFEAWQLTGDPRYHRLSRRLGEYIWNVFVGREPISYTNPQGIVGHFLFEETRDPMIAQALLLQMRWMASGYNPEAAGHGISPGPHAVAPIFEGIPAMQDVVARTDADREPVASWAAVRDFNYPVDFVFFKPDQDTVSLSLKTPSAAGRTLGGPRLEIIDPPTARGVETLRTFQHRTKLGNDTYTRWTAPRDVPEAPVRVTPSESGTHYGILRGRQPLVLHAPEYWMPWPPQDPPVRWYFRVPEDARAPAIFFENPARIFSPAGELWREADDSGWVELPADNPGLWSFEQAEPGLVRARNLPPFFAAERPESWFDPGIEWSVEEPERAVFREPDEDGFVPGPSGREDDRAVLLTGQRALEIRPGPDHPSGDGCLFLPHRQGTVEFFMRPTWSSAEKTDGFKRLSMGRMGNGRNFTVNHHFEDNTLRFIVRTREEDTGRLLRTRGQAPCIFEKGRWVHMAWTWGERVAVFVDGRRLARSGLMAGPPADPIRLLSIGYAPRPEENLDAEIDELRISDIVRYDDDFIPPEPGRKLEFDEHTRLLMNLDGNLDARSHDHDEAPDVRLR